MNPPNHPTQYSGAKVAKIPKSGWWTASTSQLYAPKHPPVIEADDPRIASNHPALKDELQSWTQHVAVLQSMVKEALASIERHHVAFMDQRNSNRKLTKLMKRASSNGLFDFGGTRVMTTIGSVLDTLVDDLDALPQPVMPEVTADFSSITSSFLAVDILKREHAEAMKNEERRFQKFCAADYSTNTDTRGTKAFDARHERENLTRKLAAEVAKAGMDTSVQFVQQLIAHFKSRAAVARLNAQHYENLVKKLGSYEATLEEERHAGMELYSQQCQKSMQASTLSEMVKDEDFRTLPSESSRLQAAGKPGLCDVLLEKLRAGDAEVSSSSSTSSAAHNQQKGAPHVSLKSKLLRTVARKRDGKDQLSPIRTEFESPGTAIVKERLKSPSLCGWIWMSKPPQKDKERCFLAVQDECLCKYNEKTKDVDIVAQLNLAHVKICDPNSTGKKWSFDFRTPTMTLCITVDSLRELVEWVTIIQEGIAQALSGDRDAGAKKRRGTTARLNNIPGNSICADCGADDPSWCSINLGILVCIKCSGSHRSLSTAFSKVRSLKMDRLSDSTLGMMLEVGNERANAYFEAKLKDFQDATKPNSSSDEGSRSQFIRQKYVELRFAPEPELPEWVPREHRDSLVTPKKLRSRKISDNSGYNNDPTMSTPVARKTSRGPVGMVLSPISKEDNPEEVNRPPWEARSFVSYKAPPRAITPQTDRNRTARAQSKPSSLSQALHQDKTVSSSV